MPIYKNVGKICRYTTKGLVSIIIINIVLCRKVCLWSFCCISKLFKLCFLAKTHKDNDGSKSKVFL